MHKPVTPGTVCVKKYFSNGTFTPEECHMFKKINFNDFFIKIIFFLCHFNEQFKTSKYDKQVA